MIYTDTDTFQANYSHVLIMPIKRIFLVLESMLMRVYMLLENTTYYPFLLRRCNMQGSCLKLMIYTVSALKNACIMCPAKNILVLYTSAGHSFKDYSKKAQTLVAIFIKSAPMPIQSSSCNVCSYIVPSSCVLYQGLSLV